MQTATAIYAEVSASVTLIKFCVITRVYYSVSRAAVVTDRSVDAGCLSSAVITKISAKRRASVIPKNVRFVVYYHRITAGINLRVSRCGSYPRKALCMSRAVQLTVIASADIAFCLCLTICSAACM